ncbi:unnamed protein product [Colias eurytheme]|nr:unnamed protein product [Colias eurytheme]
MVRYCAVSGCSESTKSNKNRRFFRFPLDEIRCKKWIKAVGRLDLDKKTAATLNSGYFVCDLHFSQSACPKKYLKPNAIPTLFLPQGPEVPGTSKCTQTECEMLCSNSEKEVTPRERQLDVKVEKKAKKRKLTETDMPPLLQKIIDAQLTRPHPQSNRYNQEYKMLALNIYFASPVTYRLLSEILCLPNIKTLQKYNIQYQHKIRWQCYQMVGSEEHLNQLLTSLEEIQKTENCSTESFGKCLQLGTNDYKFELPEENIISAVSSYLLKKCYEQHMDCDIFTKYIKIHEQIVNDFMNPPEDFKQSRAFSVANLE